MRLIAQNPSLDNLEKTFLSSAYPAGTTTFLVKNSNSLVANDRILIGDMGRERSEILTVSSVNADGVTIVTTTASKFSHSADDPVYQLRYDTIRFYRSTTGINGTYNLLVSVNLDVDNDTKQTYYNDNAGLSTYYYEISFYNSIAAIESALSDPIPGQGYSRTQLGTIINDTLMEAGDVEQEFVQVPQLIAWCNDLNDLLSSQSARPYRFLRKNPHWQLSSTANNNRISLPTDMTFIDWIQYSYNYGGFVSNPEVRIIPLSDMNELIAYNNPTATNSDYLEAVAIDPASNELILYPTPLTSQSNIFTVYGWTSFTEFTGLGGTVQTPNSLIYKLYLLSRYWRIRSIKNAKYAPLAAGYNGDYSTEVVKLIRYNRIDKGTPTGMKPDRQRYDSRLLPRQ